jgi:phenylalanyl-tRNA synthetase beta chain
MRRSVLSGVLEIMASNLRQTDRVQLFEIGSHYVPKEGQNLPEEPLRLAVAVTGPRTTESWASSEKAPAVDFFDLKGILAELLAGLHVPDLEYRPVDRSYLHPGKAAEVFTKNQSLGVFGQLHPTVAQSYGLGNRAVFIADFDLGTLLTAAPERYRFAPVPEFPPVRQDIAIVVDDALPAAKVAAEIRAGGGAMLRDVRLFDVYRGTNIPTGKKSLAYALTYQADDKTLTDKEVAKVHGKIVSRLEKVLNAQLRA